jgi:hypothetical protein
VSRVGRNRAAATSLAVKLSKHPVRLRLARR